MQEGGFFLFYESIFPPTLQFPALLLWRAITYYMALIIGLGSVVLESVRSIRRNSRLKPKAPVPAAEDLSPDPDEPGQDDSDEFSVSEGGL